ncbi:sigma 54-interacting transcriptional regulator [Alteribacter keqinensis]|nr:sigma-54 dependent transcriptional regulator [Alteribacter keqinensis]
MTNESDMTVLDETPVDLSAGVGMYVGKSPVMKEVLDLAFRWAKTDYQVLIEGETGTGKELMARFLHHASERWDRPFVAVNCGAMADSLLESELFGHEKGSFTGAHRDRKGLFEQAAGGTLFLDEIGEASEAIQVKLLRILETKEFYRIGAEGSLPMTARVITATHRPLRKRVEEGAFREDLMFRLDVGKITMPPLSKRLRDIPDLVVSLFQKEGLPERTLTDQALKRLESHPWPGNIRELNHVMIKTAVTLPAQQTIIDEGDLALPESRLDERLLLNHESDCTVPELLEAVRLYEKELIQARIETVLKETSGDRKRAAELLDLTERKLRYWLNEK